MIMVFPFDDNFVFHDFFFADIFFAFTNDFKFALGHRRHGEESAEL